MKKKGIHSASNKERRGSSRKLIEHMLAERKQLLALLLKTSSVDSSNPDSKDKVLLEEFCQVLIDYIAAGHFGLYERIVDGKERRREVAEVAKQIYPKIEMSTEQALKFTEKYGTEKNNSIFNSFQVDLSLLGESLSTRMELEDRLIARMLPEP